MSTPPLRSLLAKGRTLWTMGAHDVLSAKIVERAGFDAVGIQSLQVSIVNGVPDIGVISPEDLGRTCRKIRQAVNIPIVADFEQDFGEPYFSVYWMKELEAVGVLAIHIDDYGLPYKGPFILPQVLGLKEMEEAITRNATEAYGPILNQRPASPGNPGMPPPPRVSWLDVKSISQFAVHAKWPMKNQPAALLRATNKGSLAPCPSS